MIKIIINTKEVCLVFGYTAYRRLMTAVSQNKGIYLDDKGNFTDEAYVEVLFTGYENWCFENRKPVELTRDDFFKWLNEAYGNEAGSAFANDIFKQWKESTEVKTLIEETQKKSQPQTDSPVPTSTS